MVSKTCPYCNKISYSGAGYGQWKCPYCKKDLTHIKVNENVGSKLKTK
jgi:phage FluMu protein Com